MLQGANFRNKSSMIMYIAGLGITHVDFTIFGVVSGVRVVGGVNGAEKVAFVIFEVVGGIDAKRVRDITLAAEMARSKKEKNDV